MRKYLLFIILLVCGHLTWAQSGIDADKSSYNELMSLAMEAFNDGNYEDSYNTFCLIDSVYSITCNDFIPLMYLRALTSSYDSGSEKEKELLFRLAECKCFDMFYLEREAASYGSDTLDYWNEVVAMVHPRGYQDTVYQNRLLAMKHADMSLRHQIEAGGNDQDSLWAMLHEVESHNEAELKQLIAERGFPTWTRVGYPCVEMATYIVQFMSKEFLHWYLKEALAAIDSGDYTSSSWLNYIVDHEDINREDLDKEYIDELALMCAEDQRMRKLIPQTRVCPDSLWTKIKTTDSQNIDRLKVLIEQRGFPTYDNVGHQGVNDAALLAQHAEPEFLHWFLEQAQAAADSGDFMPMWIAYMTDRDLDHQGKPQLYGTQGLTRDGLTGMYLIKDVEHLNERRRSMDMEPIEDYLPHMDMSDFYIHPSLVDYRQYSLNLSIDGDTLRVSGFYLNPYNTATYAEAPIKVDTAYCLPLADYRTADGAIVLRREGDWYPHINGELLTAQVHIKADDYYIIGGTEWLPSFDIHLVLLPKDKYARKVMESPTRPFHFYRLASDTTQYPEAYYREFIDSYNYYCTYFGDTLTDRPMNIVEIGDPQFIMCQSLRDMIIFGHYFYDVYTMIPDFSWIPHEVAHQWWGNGIFFEYRDYALGESLTEYIKLQFLKSRGRGYEEQIEYYKATMERAEKKLPISDIHSVESQDESIAIYHAAPYRLEQMKTDVDTALKQLYRKHKHTIVSRDTFLNECKMFKKWMKAE